MSQEVSLIIDYLSLPVPSHRSAYPNFRVYLYKCILCPPGVNLKHTHFSVHWEPQGWAHPFIPWFSVYWTQHFNFISQSLQEVPEVKIFESKNVRGERDLKNNFIQPPLRWLAVCRISLHSSRDRELTPYCSNPFQLQTTKSCLPMASISWFLGQN